MAFRHLNLRNKVLTPRLDWVVGYHAGTQGCSLTRTQLTLAYFVQTVVILSGQHRTAKLYLGRASARQQNNMWAPSPKNNCLEVCPNMLESLSFSTKLSSVETDYPHWMSP